MEASSSFLSSCLISAWNSDVQLKLQQTSWIMSGLEDGGHGLRMVQQKD